MKKLAALALSLLMVLSLAACSKPAETTAPAKTVRTDLNYAVTGAPETNDPHGNSKDATQQLAHWVYDSLITIGGDGKVTPGIAEKWDTSADGLTWTFTLRDGVKFHNGAAVTADDVVWSINRCTSMAFYKNYTASFTDVTADGNKIVIKLGAPDNALLYNLYRVKILCKAEVYKIEGITAEPKQADFQDKEVDGKKVTAKKQWEEAYYCAQTKTFGQSAADAGSGPFKIESYDKDSKIVLKKFAEYFDVANTGNIQTLNIHVISEASSRLSGLQTGTLDFIEVPTASWNEISTSGKYNTQVQESTKICTLIVNHYHEGSPLGNKLVRQAIRYALNRDQIIQVAASGMGTKAYTLYNPKYIIGSSDVNKGTYEYDLQKAKDLLAEAGYPNGFKLEQKFLCPTGGDNAAVAQQIQFMLQQIGIEFDIDQQNSTTASTLSKEDNQCFYLTNSNYVFHMSDGSRAMHSRTLKTQVAKYALLPNDEGKVLDDLYDRAQAATDDKTRDDLYSQLNVWLNDQCINIPIYYQNKGFAWDKSLDADLSNPYYLYIQYWSWK